MTIRPLIKGIIIDNADTHIADDAIWVDQTVGGWILSVSIFDYTAKQTNRANTTLLNNTNTITVQSIFNNGCHAPLPVITPSQLDYAGATTYHGFNNSSILTQSIMQNWFNFAANLFYYRMRRKPDVIEKFELASLTATPDSKLYTALAKFMVSEFMILTAASIGAWAHSKTIPLIYLNNFGRNYFYDTQSWGYNVDGYNHRCGFTSPLQRKHHRKNHRIVSAYLLGNQSPYSIDQLQVYCTALNRRKNYKKPSVSIKAESKEKSVSALATKQLDHRFLEFQAMQEICKRKNAVLGCGLNN